MKAIETKWKGWRFRSRTEARWAVFLEAAGISFEYESEGVQLPSGPYLPDFRLTNFGFELPDGVERQDVWLEVKGADRTDAERERCAQLAEASGCPVLLAVGAPDFKTQIELYDDYLGGELERLIGHADGAALMALVIGDLAIMNAVGPQSDVICVGRGAREPATDADGDDAFRSVFNGFNGPVCRILGAKDARYFDGRLPIGLGEKLKAAYDAARSARFEFGQTDKRWPS